MLNCWALCKACSYNQSRSSELSKSCGLLKWRGQRMMEAYWTQCTMDLGFEASVQSGYVSVCWGKVVREHS